MINRLLARGKKDFAVGFFKTSYSDATFFYLSVLLIIHASLHEAFVALPTLHSLSLT